MKDLQGVFMNILSDQFGRYIVGIGSKRIFDFFGNQFQAGEHIKHKYNDWNDPITQLKNKSDWQGHDVNENKFFDEHVVGKWDGGILDPFASPTNVCQ